MPDMTWPEAGPIITDADFQVIRGAYREYEEHPERIGWRFTGHYDAEGDPLWHNLEMGQRHPRNRRAEFIGVFDDKCRPLYYVRPRLFASLQEPFTFRGMTWRTKGGFIAGLLFAWIPLAIFLGLGLFAVGTEGLHALARAAGLQ